MQDGYFVHPCHVTIIRVWHPRVGSALFQCVRERREHGGEGERSETSICTSAGVPVAAGLVDSGQTPQHHALERLKLTAGKKGDPREGLPGRVTENSHTSIIHPHTGRIKAVFV